MSQHNEPWEAKIVNGTAYLADCDGLVFHGSEFLPLEQAKRIVACVNACANIDDLDLIHRKVAIVDESPDM